MTLPRFCAGAIALALVLLAALAWKPAGAQTCGDGGYSYDHIVADMEKTAGFAGGGWTEIDASAVPLFRRAITRALRDGGNDPAPYLAIHADSYLMMRSERPYSRGDWRVTPDDLYVVALSRGCSTGVMLLNAETSLALMLYLISLPA